MLWHLWRIMWKKVLFGISQKRSKVGKNRFQDISGLVWVIPTHVMDMRHNCRKCGVIANFPYSGVDIEINTSWFSQLVCHIHYLHSNIVQDMLQFLQVHHNCLKCATIASNHSNVQQQLPNLSKMSHHPLTRLDTHKMTLAYNGSAHRHSTKHKRLAA